MGHEADGLATRGGLDLTELDDAVAVIRAQKDVRPRVGVVLGSGLGGFADAVEGALELPYAEIPGWPVSTAVGHAGTLVLGELAGVPVAVMKGRAHLYEGVPAARVVFGVRVLGRLGIESLVLTNACGAIDPAVAPGTLVAVSDHLNLQGASPLVGPNDETLGPRFPDMSDAYDPAYRALAQEAAQRLGLPLGEGVYAAWLGPAFETPAEIRMLRTLGADLVGMSTVPEVLAARHMGIRCLALSCVTNAAAGVLPEPIHHERVLEVGARAAGDLVALLREVLPVLGDS
ncbi:MAG TPA: purine-nucleoside phosphorylase [Gaiella sp.]